MSNSQIATTPTPDQLSSFDRELWRNPARIYSQCPFWFWNDTLREAEIRRQLEDFKAHGIDAFVIHPRIGLPQSIQWLSKELFSYMRFAVEEARRLGMWVVLYDEGMYPSGSAGGLVVARNPVFQTRGLTCAPVGQVRHNEVLVDLNPVATVPRHSGELVVIYDQPVDSVIRGLHYIGDEPELGLQEEEHTAADLLNPEAVQCFIELVYERFHQELGEFFGNTIKAIFTDEPHPLGRLRAEGAVPGTTGILDHVNSYLGYDFTPHLPSLWYDDEPNFEKHRRDYAEAIADRMNVTYYRPLYEWCEAHGVALTGHPAQPDDFGHLRHFQIPGQDIVWRHIEPYKPSALEGAPSTMAKAAASAAFHDGRKRNLNEYAGAYGHELTFLELRWLASWLLIRGCNLLSPHAFYYSWRGIRRDERPPDVGPHSSWWADFLPWATATKRLCWLNSEFRPVCHAAILGHRTQLPWKAAKICFENQIDFHYFDVKDLTETIVRNGKLYYKDAVYQVLITEETENSLIPSGVPALTGFSESALDDLKNIVSSAIAFDCPVPGVRFRHLSNDHSVSLVLLFNEGSEAVDGMIEFRLPGTIIRLCELGGTFSPWARGSRLNLAPMEWGIFLIES